MYELSHELGYVHMHQHPNRESEPIGKISIEINNAGAFSKNGRNTIIAINLADQNEIGGNGLTNGDITRL
ncbi:hypothetical protein PVAND_003313 [Polypedilum vanderplanki]|uniref:Metalloendopeptidase n=1 Tax=Polypedilum vanderplanki TaxID=319348 RepID=A0A9J6BU46_POLVA|nr:hypothetical protein PVAND_003313 [Polypedilum vanderplanki]